MDSKLAQHLRHEMTRLQALPAPKMPHDVAANEVLLSVDTLHLMLSGNEQALHEIATAAQDALDKGQWPAIRDGRGFSRPEYGWLVILQGAWQWPKQFKPVLQDLVTEAPRQTWRGVFERLDGNASICERMWLLWSHAILGEPLADLANVISEVTAIKDAWHEQPLSMTTDTWVYRELLTTHAAEWLLQLCADQDLKYLQARAIATHVRLIQPDYTTYQPWGLVAYASYPSGVAMAHQQLHDVRVHEAIEGNDAMWITRWLYTNMCALLEAREQ